MGVDPTVEVERTPCAVAPEPLGTEGYVPSPTLGNGWARRGTQKGRGHTYGEGIGKLTRN